MAFRYRICQIITSVPGIGLSFYTLGSMAYAETDKKNTQLEIGNVDTSVPKKLEDLVSEVMDDLKLSPRLKNRVQPYLINGSDITHFGFCKKDPGVFLGLPLHFLIDDNLNFNLTTVINEAKLLPPDSEEAESLRSALSLSKDAKKFAIACEINKSNQTCIYLNLMIPLLIAAWANGLLIKTRQNPRVFGNGPYLKTVAWAIIPLYLFNKIMDAYREADSVVSALRLGNSYIKGALEFYEKLVIKNKIIARLKKDSPYFINGDMEGTFTKPIYRPITRRVKYLKYLVQPDNAFKEPSLLKYLIP